MRVSSFLNLNDDEPVWIWMLYSMGCCVLKDITIDVVLEVRKGVSSLDLASLDVVGFDIVRHG